MHWFDRLSRGLAAAPEAQTTRRGVLKGAGVAVVATPFTSYAAAYAKNTIKAQTASDACSKCLTDAYKDYKNTEKFWKKLFAKAAKKQGKLTKAQSATLITYLINNRQTFIEDGNLCKRVPCAPASSPTTGPTDTGSTTCPPGTSPCPGAGYSVICCYGGDACCVCASVDGGYICCAGVIGCQCC